MTDNGPVLVVGGTGMLGGQVVTELLSAANGCARWYGRHRTRHAFNGPAWRSHGDMMDPDRCCRR